VIIFQLGGALSKVGENDTAYSQRDAAHNLNINAVWLRGERDENAVRWARELRPARAVRTRPGVYQLPRR